jgi:hypothetical protein
MEQTMERLLGKIEAMQEKMISHHEEITAKIRVWRKNMKADRESTEAYPEKMKANPEEMKSVTVREKVLKEEVAVKTTRALKEWYEDLHLVVGRRRRPKKQTQSNGGFLKKLVAARRGLIPRRCSCTAQGTWSS